MKELKESRNEDFFESDTILTNCIYIGDPCYFMLEDVYNEWGTRYNYKDGTIESKLRNSAFIVCGTKYGDGEYDSDQNGKKFSVDAGCICIADGNLGDVKKLKSAKELGLFISLPKLAPTTISLSYEDGTITAKYSQGKTSQSVSIFTDEDEDDEWEDNSDDWEDSDYTEEFNEDYHDHHSPCYCCGSGSGLPLKNAPTPMRRFFAHTYGLTSIDSVCHKCIDNHKPDAVKYGWYDPVDTFDNYPKHPDAVLITSNWQKCDKKLEDAPIGTKVYIQGNGKEETYIKFRQKKDPVESWRRISSAINNLYKDKGDDKLDSYIY